MRPNLSLEKIAEVLAVLGTSVLMSACGGDKPANSPVDGKEATPTGEKASGDKHCGADAKHKDGEKSCGAADGKGAGSCGAGKAGGAGSCGAGKTGTPATPTTGDAPKPPADTPKPPDTATKPATPTAPTDTAKKPGTPPAAGKKGGSGSCGAGTCSAKK